MVSTKRQTDAHGDFMRSFLSPFALILTSILALAYWYVFNKFSLLPGLLLFFPFLGIWLLPVLYWSGLRRDGGKKARVIHIISYISMGWLSSLFSFLLILDVARWILRFSASESIGSLEMWGPSAAVALATFVTVFGSLFMRTGPSVKEISISLDGLPEELNGLRIAQISDLHVGPLIRKGYVKKVVAIANALNADFVALTGDFVDGSVADLAEHIAPLKELEPLRSVFFIMGNHDYYSGASSWMQEFRSLGFEILLNSQKTIAIKGRKVLVAGVTDPAARMLGTGDLPDPEKAFGNGTGDLKILLAHNPSIAEQAEKVGFDIQLSGHTHGGQFWPWTWVVKRVHNPHYLGLSRRGRMWVYVNAGTGSWGPPLRLGTTPEISLIRIISSKKV